MSLSENLYNLGALMKTNLEEKGIDGLTGNEGLTTLANKILDVEPSVAGLELSTSIDCNVSSNEILLGQSVVFSATLSASYDDTSIEDIDISGVLTGATVLFKTSDGTIIGSGVTDVNGVATYTHTIEEIGNITVYSEFEESTNFSSCISSTTVTVECSYNFEVTVDKKILSANDNDIATVNCILSDSTGVIAGESIDYQILHNDTILDEGTLTTDNTGKITLEYAATGVGNVDVIFSLRSILQETYELIDYMFYDDATTDNLSAYDINNQIQIYGSTRGTMTYDSSNQRYNLDTTNNSTILIPINTITPNNLIMEADIYLSATDAGCNLGFGFYNQSTNSAIQFVGISNTNLSGNIYENADYLFGNKTIRNKWILLKVEVQGQNIVMSMFDKSDNSLIATYNYTMALAVTSNTRVGLARYGGNDSYKGYIRNIKVKAL